MTDPIAEGNPNMLGMKSIIEAKEKSWLESYADTMKRSISADWIFEGWEKILITVCFLWSCWSLGQWIWRLFA
jgi:hypothetical protein